MDAHIGSYIFYEDLYRSDRITVGERSNFKKIPTHTQDHGDA